MSRVIKLPNAPEVIISDTVGFIRNLPHELIASFKSTLDDVRDADVLLHAICDAILGALGAGDIGRHFPDSDPAYRGISSVKLLREVITLTATQGYAIGNLDATVIAQRPRLAPHIRAMVEAIAAACQCDIARVNVKATTTEELGFTGRGEGIAAHAVVLLQRAAGDAAFEI
jgi:2-C-methyl-D-erythritol 2,4-cyclodiphosphate synthase